MSHSGFGISFVRGHALQCQWAEAGSVDAPFAPQRLGVEGITRPLRDTVIVDGGVGRRRGATSCRAAEGITGKAASSLHPARVVVEVRVAATGGAPQHYFLIIRVILGEESVKGERLARSWGKEPGHPISQAVWVTGATATPAITRGFAFVVERD